MRRKTYGRTPYLPGTAGRVWIQEKLAGTNVAVARLDGERAPQVRQGFRARVRRALVGPAPCGVRSGRAAFWRAAGGRVARCTPYALRPAPRSLCGPGPGGRPQRRPFLPLRARVEGVFAMPELYSQEARDPAELRRNLVAAKHPGHHGAFLRPEGFVYRAELPGEAGFLASGSVPNRVPVSDSGRTGPCSSTAPEGAGLFPQTGHTSRSSGSGLLTTDAPGDDVPLPSLHP
ncbi:hypothetical protein [Deinococcus hopiensis]|uniref:Uncharacterized protein n=1 Tax=Deinococcus hopiensis KR-140 TaxID=695939 RepID=A0A1W1VN61_9DEIO|nr:hypothetical protein [Deinococcus hopiensis]SMB94768.1 hypothetical protein SAMN00790413_02518 [Deinococcus hopiensis KR-140]